MRKYPTSDAKREEELGALVREVAGEACRFHADGPQVATWVLGEIWGLGPVEDDSTASASFLVLMAMATDGLRGARAALYACDFGGLWVQIRRCQELVTLAVALAMNPVIADEWLSGKEVSQIALRKAIEKTHPIVSEKLRLTYGHLSDEAHGRVQAVSAYADERERFSWPVEAADINRHHVWSSHLTYCAITLELLGVLHWMGHGSWSFLRPETREVTEAYYEALATYMTTLKDSGEWWMFPPNESRAWLLESYGMSWEDRELAGAKRASPSLPVTDDPA